MATLLFQMAHVIENQYIFSVFLYDGNGSPIPNALIEYYKRRAAPGQTLPAWETTRTGGAYTGADGTIRFEAAFDVSLTGYKDQWKMFAPAENVWSDIWEFTIGGDAYRVVIESPAPPNMTAYLIPILIGAAAVGVLIWYFWIRKPKPQPVQIIQPEPGILG